VIGRSALIGTGIGALPGVGSSLAAMLGYGAAKRRQRRRGHPGAVPFGEGAPEGVAATESANSSVAGANLIPVLSLGIPGNVSAVFIVLAAETIDGLSPGPTAFRINAGQVNPELVIVFGLFTSMVLSNMLNWVIGARLMRALGVMARVPVRLLMPVILLITLTGIYLQEMRFSAMVAAIGFGMLGYGMRHLGISPLPFAIAFILAERLESTSRQAYSATGGDAFFLFSSPISILLMLGAVLVLILSARAQRGAVEAVRETAGRNGT
jgi:putative tricarboxylic transport membrane protein